MEKMNAVAAWTWLTGLSTGTSINEQDEGFWYRRHITVSSFQFGDPVQYHGHTGTEAAACSAHEVVVGSTLSSSRPAAMGNLEGWVTRWTEDMSRQRGRRESPGRSLSSRESLLIMCGRGLLGHLHSCGPAAGPCLWAIWARPAELVWWNERWCVSEGAISSLAKGLKLLDLIREGPSGRCRVASQTNWLSWPVGISLWSLACVRCRVVCWKSNLNISIIEAEDCKIDPWFDLMLMLHLYRFWSQLEGTVCKVICSVKGRQEGKWEWNGQIIRHIIHHTHSNRPIRFFFLLWLPIEPLCSAMRSGFFFSSEESWVFCKSHWCDNATPFWQSQQYRIIRSVFFGSS